MTVPVIAGAFAGAGACGGAAAGCERSAKAAGPDRRKDRMSLDGKRDSPRVRVDLRQAQIWVNLLANVRTLLSPASIATPAILEEIASIFVES